MKAVYIEDFGGPEKLKIRDMPEPPQPTGSMILVRVKAAGLNRADIAQRRGLYMPPAGYSPNIPGLEFAGEIAAVGDGVDKFAAADRVFGITAGEAQAELLLIDQSLAAAIPDDISFTDAAAFPEAFITAHDSIFSQAALQPHETLLIHAVASGVGLAALQIAKAAGARVVGTSRSDRKLERCERFGLDVPILVPDPPSFAETILRQTDSRGADVILDLVGGSYFSENIASLAAKGRLMLVGLTGGARSEINLGAVLARRTKIIGTVLRSRSVEEKALAVARFTDDVVPQIAQKRLNPNVDRVFSLSDVRAAHEYLESNQSFGKVVLEV